MKNQEQTGNKQYGGGQTLMRSDLENEPQTESVPEPVPWTKIIWKFSALC